MPQALNLLGFFIPDYTAYNEMLSLFRNVGELVTIFYCSTNPRICDSILYGVSVQFSTVFKVQLSDMPLNLHSLPPFPHLYQKTMATTFILRRLRKRLPVEPP